MALARPSRRCHCPRRGATRAIGAALLMAVTLSAAPASAQDPDPWFGKDKALHFAASATIAAGGYTVGAFVFEARAPALLLGGGLAAAAGIGKETLDLAGYGDPSWRDLAWDGIGTVFGLALAWGIDLLVRGVSERHPALGPPRASAPEATTRSVVLVF